MSIISLLPLVHPMPQQRHSPRESMSLDSQSPTAPYESSSFATLQAGVQQPVLKLEQFMKYQLCGALLSTVHILHRMCKSGEVRRLACP